MAVTKTGATALKYYNPKYLLVTPFTDANTKGATTYLVENVVRDTTTITQEDNEENPVDNEFTSEPIVNNIVAGSYTFASEVGDLQGDLVEALAGFKVDETSSKIYAPDGYVEVFAEIALVFASGAKYIAAILPKVQINATVLIESLNTSVGRLTLSGTGYNLEMTDGENKYITPFMLDPNYTLPAGIITLEA